MKSKMKVWGAIATSALLLGLVFFFHLVELCGEWEKVKMSWMGKRRLSF